MTTNSTGTETKWSSSISVDGNLIFNGIYGSPGQFVIKSSGSQLWHTLSTSDLPPGTNNQVLETSGSSVDWTSQLKMNSILFTGNISNFQSIFDRYYTSTVQFPLYAVASGGSPSTYQNINVNGYFSVIGKRIELTIFPFTLSSLFGGATAPCYLSMLIGPSYLRPANLSGSGGSGYRQSTCMCSISQNQTTQSEPAFANIYNDYYGSGVIYLELTKGNASNFISTGYHGEPFVTAGLEFMELKSPFTISYIGI